MGMNQHGLRMASSHINIPDACSTSRMEGMQHRERQTMADLTSVMLETELVTMTTVTATPCPRTMKFA